MVPEQYPVVVGTKPTRDCCVREKTPFLRVDAGQVTVDGAVSAVLRFIAEHSLAVMNVAGPRLSSWPDEHRFALEVVVGGMLAGTVLGKT